MTVIKAKILGDDEAIHGEASKGVAHPAFERMILNWAMDNYDQVYGKDLWENKLLNLDDFDMNNHLNEYCFHEHLSLIQDIMTEENAKQAELMFNSNRFWTIAWHKRYRARQYTRLYIFLQSICRGEALRQLEDFSVPRTPEIRAHFIVRFGGARAAEVKIRELAYLSEMPDEIGGLAFKPNCNMEVKLNQLETERTFFWKNCPAECRDTYEYGTESKLIHIVLEHLPVEYDSTVKDVKNVLKLRMG